MRRRLRNRIAAAAFGIAGVGFLVVAFIRSASSSTDLSVVPGPVAIVVASGLVGIGLACAAPGWWVLFEASTERKAAFAAAFYSAQLGKYVPGGVWQAFGQVGLTSGAAGVSTVTATITFPVHVITQVAAGAAVGSLLVSAGPVPSGLRALSGAGVLLVLLLHRGWMSRVLRWLDQRFGKEWNSHLPRQRAIVKSFLWGVLTLAFSGSGLAVLLRSLSPVDGFGTIVVSFSLAWVVGFLAIPVPSGLGVREGILIGALASTSALVIAAAVTHRLITMGIEVLFIAGSRVVDRRRRTGDVSV